MDILVRALDGDDDIAAFRALNEEWVTTYFTMEPQDALQLADPKAAYLDTGGEILIAEHDGTAVGCVAIVPDGTGAWELSKMAVTPGLRGQGVGRRLLQATIARARELGAESLFLGSNSKLTSAVHLYERMGFEHVDPASLHMPYERANVFMRLQLQD